MYRIDYELVVAGFMTFLFGGVALFKPLVVARIFAALNSGPGNAYSVRNAEQRDFIDQNPSEYQRAYAGPILYIRLIGAISWFLCGSIILALIV